MTAQIIGGAGLVDVGSGDVGVSAIDNSLIVAITGGGSGAGGAAVGAAVSTNKIAGMTTAAIEDATVRASTIDVHAGAGERDVPPDGDMDQDGHIVALSIGGSGAGGFALGGSVSVNQITRTTEAHMDRLVDLLARECEAVERLLPSV